MAKTEVTESSLKDFARELQPLRFPASLHFQALMPIFVVDAVFIALLIACAVIKDTELFKYFELDKMQPLWTVLGGTATVLVILLNGISLLSPIGHCGFKCPYCGKHISSGTPWVCGYCDYETDGPPSTRITSFMGFCWRCNTPPKAYICTHCEGVVYLDDDLNGDHAARQVLERRDGESEEEAKARRINEVAEKEAVRRQELVRITQETERLKAEAERTVAEQRLKNITSPPEKTDPIAAKHRNKLAELMGEATWIPKLKEAQLEAEASLKRSRGFKQASPDEQEAMLRRVREKFNPDEFTLDY